MILKKLTAKMNYVIATSDILYAKIYFVLVKVTFLFKKHYVFLSQQKSVGY